MTLKDVIRKAVEQNDAQAAGIASDFMRFRLGMTYEESFQTVKDVCPDVSLSLWDALLRDSEDEPRSPRPYKGKRYE